MSLLLIILVYLMLGCAAYCLPTDERRAMALYRRRWARLSLHQIPVVFTAVLVGKIQSLTWLAAWAGLLGGFCALAGSICLLVSLVCWALQCFSKPVENDGEPLGFSRAPG
ncbi:hypothetical protein IV102_17760 [bacterium]|nr:hypothetical protein [bacterium]